ncbi:MAG TPA: hypothetical protein VJB96_05045 [Patescibacteria group bacterium]|nr:hypothetical protein [Patescibacteria group bacterium]
MIERKESPVPDVGAVRWEDNGALRVQGKTMQKKEPLVKRVLVGSWDATKKFIKSQSPEAHGHRILEIIEDKIVPKLNEKWRKRIEDHADGIRDAAMLAGAGVTTAEIIAAVAAAAWGFGKLFPYRESPQEQFLRTLNTIVTEHQPAGHDRDILLGAVGTLVAAGVNPTMTDALSRPTSDNHRKNEIRRLKNRFGQAVRRHAIAEDGRRAPSSYVNKLFLDWMDMLQVSSAPGHDQQVVKDWVRGQRDASDYARIRASMPPEAPEFKRPKTSPLIRRQSRLWHKEQQRTHRHNEVRKQKAEKRKKRRAQLTVHITAPTREELHLTPSAHSRPEWRAKKAEVLPTSTDPMAFAMRLAVPRSAQMEPLLQTAIQNLDAGNESFSRLMDVLGGMVSNGTLPSDLDRLAKLSRSEQSNRIHRLRKKFYQAYVDAHYYHQWHQGSSITDAQQLFSTWMDSLGVDAEGMDAKRPHLRRVPRRRTIVPDAERRHTQHHAYLDGVLHAVEGHLDEPGVRVLRDAVGRLTDPDYVMVLPPEMIRSFMAAVRSGDVGQMPGEFRNLLMYAAQTSPHATSDDVITDAIDRYIGMGAPGIQRVMQTFGIPLGEAKNILGRMRQPSLSQIVRDHQETLRKQVDLSDVAANARPVHVAWRDASLQITPHDLRRMAASQKTLLQESPERVRALLHRIVDGAQPDINMVHWMRQLHHRWQAGEVPAEELPNRMRFFARQMLARSGVPLTKQERLDILQAWEQQGFDLLPKDAKSLGRYLERFKEVPTAIKSPEKVMKDASERVKSAKSPRALRTSRRANYQLQPLPDAHRVGFDEPEAANDSYFADLRVQKRKLKRIPLPERLRRTMRRVVSQVQKIGKKEAPTRRFPSRPPPQPSPQELELQRELEAADRAAKEAYVTAGEIKPIKPQELQTVYDHILRARAGEIGKEARNVFYRPDPSGVFHNRVDGAYTVRDDSLRIPTPEMISLVEQGYRLAHPQQKELTSDEQLRVQELAARMVNQPTSFPLLSIMGHSSRWWDPKKGRAISTKP